MLSAPQLLIAFRATCAPALFVLACFRFSGGLLAAIVIAALISDILDGVVARRTGGATDALRHADTIVDTVFFVGAAIALRVAVPRAWDGLWVPLILLIVVHVSRSTYELTKYGRLAAYHMWSSKALGLLLVAALVTAFISGRPTRLLGAALWLGVVNELEGFLASVILPAWRCDVPTIYHAARQLAGEPHSQLARSLASDGASGVAPSDARAAGLGRSRR